MDSRYKIIAVHINLNCNKIHLQDLRKTFNNFSTNKLNSLIFTHDKYNIPTGIHNKFEVNLGIITEIYT